VVCPVPAQRSIDRQYRGPATRQTAAKSAMSDDPTTSSRHVAACRQGSRYLIPVISRTPRPNTPRPTDGCSVGAVSAPVDTRRRRPCVRPVNMNVEYKSGQNEISLALVARHRRIIIRSVLGDVNRCTTAAYLQWTQVLLLIIQSRTGMPRRQ